MMTRRWRSSWQNNIFQEIHQKYTYIWKHSRKKLLNAGSLIQAKLKNEHQKTR